MITVRRSLWHIGLALAAGLLPFAAVNAQEAAKTPLDFELSDGSAFVRLSDLPPRITIVNFWRYDCPPCVREMPLFADIARAGRARVVVVALQRPGETEQRSPATVAEAIKPPVVLLHGPSDPRGLLSRFGNPRGALPHTVVVDARRHSCAARTGEVDAAWLDDAPSRCPP